MAPAGATIWVYPGLYKERITVGTLGLTIKGANAGRDDTIFQGNGVGLDLGANGEQPSVVCRNRFIANNEANAGGFGVFSTRGARQVLITYNRFERHNSAAIFIGARNDQVLVDRNRVHSASGNGIDVTDSAEPHQGREDLAPTHVTVSRNEARQAAPAGPHMAGGTSGVSVTANTALGNKVWDCQDESAGVKNTWQDNVGRRSRPARLCGAATGAAPSGARPASAGWTARRRPSGGS